MLAGDYIKRPRAALSFGHWYTVNKTVYLQQICLIHTVLVTESAKMSFMLTKAVFKYSKIVKYL